jgi:hypothetical protein
MGAPMRGENRAGILVKTEIQASNSVADIVLSQNGPGAIYKSGRRNAPETGAVRHFAVNQGDSAKAVIP